MRVITINDYEFQQLCNRLATAISSDGFSPECIVGIRNAGALVAKEIAKYFPDAHCIEVSVSRPTHKHKNNPTVRSILKLLPLWLLNAMRMAESFIAQFHKNASRNANMSFSQSITASRILIVDDAIDTGATIELVLNTLAQIAPCSDIRTAVITVTTPSPSVFCNYALFRNRTLIRFPWAIDAKI